MEGEPVIDRTPGSERAGAKKNSRLPHEERGCMTSLVRDQHIVERDVVSLQRILERAETLHQLVDASAQCVVVRSLQSEPHVLDAGGKRHLDAQWLLYAERIRSLSQDGCKEVCQGGRA